MSQENKTFEENMRRLEQIVRSMERGDVALEESLKLLCRYSLHILIRIYIFGLL